MKKKHAVRPIRRTSPESARPVAGAAAATRRYPDARTLAEALRDAATRAIRIAAIPTAGLFAGCTAASGDVVDGLSGVRLPWQDRIGTVVEGLRAPEESVPLAGAQVPVQPDFQPPIPQIDPPPLPPPVELNPIPLGGAPRPVQPPPPPERPPTPRGSAMRVDPDPDPPEVVGLMGMVHAEPGPARLVHAGPIPTTLSDEALAAALASIAS